MIAFIRHVTIDPHMVLSCWRTECSGKRGDTPSEMAALKRARDRGVLPKVGGSSQPEGAAGTAIPYSVTRHL